METLPWRRTDEMDAPTVRVSDLRQWTYCPRVFWWMNVCPVGKKVSVKMRAGLEKERRLQQLQRRRTLRAYGLARGTVEANVSLGSDELGLTGRLDLVVRQGAVRYPVEIKYTQGPARLNHRLQLAGYALLLEAAYGVPVSHGYILRLPDDTADKVPIDAPLRDLTLRTITALRITLRDERIPPVNALTARCIDCEYRCYCGDVAEPAGRRECDLH